MKMKFGILGMAFFILIAIFSFTQIKPNKASHRTALHVITTRTANDLKDFFTFTTDRLPLVSAHRGGPRKGYPENCIATFENTLSHTHALLEIDPHYTKDSAIVLMHDPTLDRTTTGSGKVSDYTLEEIKKLRLKDTEGNITPYQIPTLDEALQWAKGKTILVIDAKDVPIEVRAKKILENKAEANAIVISYSLEDTKKCYQLSSDILIEVMMGKMENVKAFDSSGVPWQNTVPFVSHQLPENTDVFKAVHERKAFCIQGSSRNYDRQYTTGKIGKRELLEGYQALINHGADIIEADLGIEAGEALALMQQKQSSKRKYFSMQ